MDLEMKSNSILSHCFFTSDLKLNLSLSSYPSPVQCRCHLCRDFALV